MIANTKRKPAKKAPVILKLFGSIEPELGVSDGFRINGHHYQLKIYSDDEWSRLEWADKNSALVTSNGFRYRIERSS